jgi:hypothetical protein
MTNVRIRQRLSRIRMCLELIIQDSSFGAVAAGQNHQAKDKAKHYKNHVFYVS